MNKTLKTILLGAMFPIALLGIGEEIGFVPFHLITQYSGTLEEAKKNSETPFLIETTIKNGGEVVYKFNPTKEDALEGLRQNPILEKILSIAQGFEESDKSEAEEGYDDSLITAQYSSSLTAPNKSLIKKISMYHLQNGTYQKIVEFTYKKDGSLGQQITCEDIRQVTVLVGVAFFYWYILAYFAFINDFEMFSN